MRKITSWACEARFRWKNRASKTWVLITEMDKVLPHGTRVPKKKTNKDDNEDEELEMGRKSKTGESEMGRRSRTRVEEAEVPNSKTSLENTDSTKKNHGLIRWRRITGEGKKKGEEEAAQKVNGGTWVLKTWVLRGFFSTSTATTCNLSFKNSISILEFEF